MDTNPFTAPRPLRLLLVDCNDTLRTSLDAWLQQEFPGVWVDTVANRPAAEALAGENPPAVVLVNIDARRGEGYATLRSLRVHLPGALLIGLSLYPVEYFREQASKAGANACACIALADNRLRDLLQPLLPTSRQAVTAVRVGERV